MLVKELIEIAVLMTCHNRKEKTVRCLQSLNQCELPDNLVIKVFLVDDGSTDGTGEEAKKEFDNLSLIQGDGSLFWNQGMRLAWETAFKNGSFQYFLWLNDDTILEKNAIIELIETYQEVVQISNRPGIIVGSCKVSDKELVFSYGGRSSEGPIIPNGELQLCNYINGNIVLVSEDILRKVGNFSADFTHGMGDIDYGLRARKEGYKSYVSKTYIGICEPNGVPDWSNPNVPMNIRVKNFYSPLGLNYKEYIVFRKKHWGINWMLYSLKAHVKLLFPKLYENLKNN